MTSKNDVFVDKDTFRRWLNEEEESLSEDSTALRDSVIIYGSILVVVILIFSFVRQRYPKVYNVRSWVEDIQTYLADEQYRFISWLWRVYMVTDDELMAEASLDAACFIRILQMGFRLSVLSIFNLIWLLPLYYTAEESAETAAVGNGVVRTTIANVPSGSARLYGTVIAAYIFFGYTMYTIHKEFDWYIEMRHKFLRKPLARHFAVFVRNIPNDVLDNQRLVEFFRSCFSAETVLEARLSIKCPQLAQVVNNRDATLANLEHALALFRKQAVRPRHKDSIMMVGGTVDSIDFYTTQLEEQNKDIAERISKLEAIVEGTNNSTKVVPELAPTTESDELRLELPTSLATGGYPQDDDDIVDIDLNVSGLTTNPSGERATVPETESLTADPEPKHKRSSSFDVSKSLKKAKSAAGKVSSSAKKAGNMVASMVASAEDGGLHAAGFVVFSKLSTTNAALQMIHHPAPFSMEVSEAPDPEDVNWSNMYRSHKDLQVGRLLSLAMTSAVCLLWTIPMSFFASLSNVSAVREDVDWLDDLFNKYPGLVNLTEQLAPFLVIIFNALLPPILGFISNFEGPISNSVLEASVFVKLSAFMIIQTFFVSAVSGSIMEALSDIIDDWTEIIDLLANTLPAQSTYFMQILLVSTAIGALMELLRIVPLILAALRKRIGPNLTKKERSKTVMGLRPLSDPSEFEHGDVTSQLVLYFMVLFVYAVISPITCLVTMICFLFMGSMYRHQFIHIYPKKPDTGGMLWANFIQIMLTCMMIAQITILGLLSLKKGVIAVPLYIPLPCVTILFNLYIRQMHFRVASYLPTKDCIKEDLKRDSEFDMSFVKGAYVQPPLAAKEPLAPEEPFLISESMQNEVIPADEQIDDGSFVAKPDELNP